MDTAAAESPLCPLPASALCPSGWSRHGHFTLPVAGTEPASLPNQSTSAFHACAHSLRHGCHLGGRGGVSYSLRARLHALAAPPTHVQLLTEGAVEAAVLAAAVADWRCQLHAAELLCCLAASTAEPAAAHAVSALAASTLAAWPCMTVALWLELPWKLWKS